MTNQLIQVCNSAPGSALLQRISVAGGEAFYTSRFVRTRSFQQNSRAGRIVAPEFGTAAGLPGLSLSSVLSDNTMINVVPFSGSLYTFYESPFLHRVEPRSET